MRPSSRIERNCLNPAPRGPSRFSDAATLQHQPVRVGRVPPHLAVGRFDGESRRPGRHDDGRDLARPLGPAAAGRHRDDAGDRRPRVGDERLGPVDHPLAADQRRAAVGRPGVRTSIRLGQPEGAQCPAGAELGQPLVLLVFGAEGEDGIGAEPHAGLQGDGHRRVDPPELFDRDAERGEVRPRSPVLLGERQPEQPQLPHGQDRVDREDMVAVPLLGVRRDLPLGEVTDDLAEGLLFVAQVEVHGNRS